MKIKISESQFRYIIREAINEAAGIEEKFPPGFIQKKGKQWAIDYMTKKHPELDPAGFFVVGDAIRSNGKLRPKPMQKPKISKPEGMSPKEYEETIVKRCNPKYQEDSQTLYPGEEFRPVVNTGRYFRGEADFSSYYEISNYGRLKVIDFSDASKCRIMNGYDAPTSRAMQFNLNGEQHTCPPVHSMVADAFLEPKDPHDFMVRHINGDYHDNRAENLQWVPRKNRKENLSVKLKG
ncbi:MAG: HNH endonuclease [Paludibacteraceae bacterium]|nr:HNH endonuclease [Paludibacteraceae bacterium]